MKILDLVRNIKIPDYGLENITVLETGAQQTGLDLNLHCPKFLWLMLYLFFFLKKNTHHVLTHEDC